MILVTGANSPIGSAIVKTLEARADDVIAYTRTELDLNDINRVLELANTLSGIRGVVHNAAMFTKDSTDHIRVNYLSRRVLDAVAEDWTLDIIDACPLSWYNNWPGDYTIATRALRHWFETRPDASRVAQMAVGLGPVHRHTRQSQGHFTRLLLTVPADRRAGAVEVSQAVAELATDPIHRAYRAVGCPIFTTEWS